MGSLEPNFIRCEYLINPLGIDVVNPRLSWILESEERGQKQTAYRIIVSSSIKSLNGDKGDLWDTGQVNSDQTIHIEYEGKPLESQQYCYWKVKAWDKDNKDSEWSNIAHWNMGFLKESDWKAKWIGEPHKKMLGIKKYLPIRKYRPSPLLRKSFLVKDKVKVAYVYVSALGEYEISINGTRIGNHIFAPEWTDYNTRVQYQTFDVKDLIIEGENVIGAILGDGWYSGNLGPMGLLHYHYGVSRKIIVQLIIEYEDGKKEEVNSDSDWKMFMDGPIQKSDHFKGETYDSRKEQKGWDKPNFDDSLWEQVVVDDVVNIKLVAQMNEPIRIVKELKPIEITEPKSGVFIFNIGQNIAGRCKIHLNNSVYAPDGVIKLRHGEMLKENGELFTANLGLAKATDTIILNGQETFEFQPHFTYHGFQYIEITGLKPGVKPSLDIITACAISSDTRVVGEFESSDQTLNKLWSNILWTQRDNLISVPTDCPQRGERMGWMGDAQVFCQTSIFNMDMAAFNNKWVRDIRDAQDEYGRFPDFVPYPRNKIYQIWKFYCTAGWADCGIILPWITYLNYNDKKIIEKHYDSAKRFIDHIHLKNPDLIWTNSIGNEYNDWLNGDTTKLEGYPKKGGEVPFNVFSTAFFARSTLILSRMAELLGKNDDATYYRELAEKIKAVFNSNFVDEDNKILGDTQAGYAIALNFDLLPESVRSQVANNMIKAIEKYDNRISTGFISTIALMLELTRWGYNDLAYKLLLSRRVPSWFFMIDQGATTMWERWDGYVKGRGVHSTMMNSFNHFSIGAVGEWMYRVILGINLDEKQPGYKHIIIKPQPGGGLTSVKGSYESIRGTIAVSWEISDDTFNLEVSIPTNTTATVYIIAENIDSIIENGIKIQDSEELKVLSFKSNIASILINSGTYHFISKNSF